MAQQNLAQAFVRQMAAWGVKTVFGVTGDDILPFMDALAGDVKHIINTLTQRLQGYQTEPAWRERVAQAKNQLKEIVAADAENNEKPIHPARLMTSLNKVIADDAVIALDDGAFNHWFDRTFQAASQQILLSSRWRSMGAGLPAAIRKGT